MRVISQNRMYSVNFDNVMLWRQYEMIYAKIGSENIVLGQYESEERAAEVFLDIHNAYAPVGIISTNLNEAQIEPFIGSENVCIRSVQMNEPDTGITTYDNFIYWMPEK